MSDERSCETKVYFLNQNLILLKPFSINVSWKSLRLWGKVSVALRDSGLRRSALTREKFSNFVNVTENLVKHIIKKKREFGESLFDIVKCFSFMLNF